MKWSAPAALTGQGMDELLETLLTIAELNDFQANPTRAALERAWKRNKGGRGVIAKMMVQNGTLRVGDVISLRRATYGRVKAVPRPRFGPAFVSKKPVRRRP
ncbi:MAG: hypothetical protein R3C99_20615 [Pirellulaceae bacterium]